MGKMKHYIRLGSAIFACCINTSFTRGYNSMCLYNIINIIAEWAHEPIIEQSYEELNTSNTIVSFSFSNLVDVAYGFGAIFGSSIVYHYSKKFGRKGGLLMTNVACIFGILFSGYCKLFDKPLFLVVGRILLGIKNGICSCIASMYLCDIVPRNYRGKVGAIYSFFCVIGEVTGYLASRFLATENGWPLVFSLNILPVIIQLIILPICPESPKYTFVIKNKELECRKDFLWLRGSNLNKEEYNEFIYELLQQKQLGGMSLKVFAEHVILMRALFICTVLLVSAPLCGVRIIIKYAAQSNLALKNESGEPDIPKQIAFQISLTLVSFLNIFTVDSIPRQTLLFSTFLIMSFCCAINCLLVNFFVDINSLIIVMIIFLYLICFKVGCGCISYFIVCEYFNTLSAPLAFSIGMTLSSMLSVSEQLFANRLEVFLKGYLFLSYTIINGALAYFCYSYVIDTRFIPLKIVYRMLHDQLII